MNYIKTANSPPSSLVLASFSTIQNVELILEQFFDHHIAYQWDKAKEYIEHERDQFRAKSSHSILVSMLHYLAQVIVADRNYLTLQFFSPKVFQRKDLLKSTYENLKNQFQRLEERSNQLFLKHNFHLLPFQSSPIHNFQQQQVKTSISVGSISELYDESEPAREALDCMNVVAAQEIVPETNQDNRCASDVQAVQDNNDQLSSSLPKDSSDLNLSSTKSSFFSKFFRKFSSPNSQTIQAKSQDISSLSMMENLPDDQLISTESTSSINLDSLDQFAGHICGQLVNYCRVRMEMIDFYERLANIDHLNVGKFCILDDFVKTLTDIHNFADDNFHHPVLTRVKIMFMFECDVLLSLLRAQQFIQQWKYLESLFQLQEAYNKINRLMNPKEFFFGTMMLTPGYASISTPSQNNAIVKASSSPTSNSGLRNLTSSTSSSGSNAATPTIINNTPSSSNPLNFVFPGKDLNNSSSVVGANMMLTSTTTTKNLFQRVQTSSNMVNDPKSVPLLIQWFNKYKLFLLSKYSFYFHSLLLIHLTPVQSVSFASSSSISLMNSSNSLSSLISQNQSSPPSIAAAMNSASSNSANYAQTELYMRNLCMKHLPFDIHAKIVQFLKKLDSTNMVLLLNTNNRTVSMNGYKSPFVQKDSLQGKSSLPIIYSHPGEFNMNRHPSLIMIMNNHLQALNSSDQVVVEHDKSAKMATDAINMNNIRNNDLYGNNNKYSDLSNSSPDGTATTMSATNDGTTTALPNATYYLIRPDPNYTLALICESKRNERDAHIISFMQELHSSLKDVKILASLRTGTFKKS